MSDIKTAKDSLVASLFELSKAAQDAAAATVNFYKVSHEGAPDVSSLSSLSQTIKSVATAVKGSSTSNGSSTKASTATAAPPAPAPVAKPASTTSSTASSNASTTSTANTASTTGSGSGSGATAAAPSTIKPEEETKTKKKKVERDPNAPKKPLTIYFAYLFHTRDRIKEERERAGLEALSVNDMNELIKDKWSNITADEKARWQKKYANELKDYQKEKDKYKATLAAGGVPPPRKNEPIVHSAPVDEEPISTDAESPKKKEKKRKSEKLEKSKEKKSKK